MTSGRADDVTDMKAGLAIRTFATEAAFESWVVARPDAVGVWVRIAKSGGGESSITYQQALDVALCLGWIDGQKCAWGEGWWLQRFTPRRPRGRWSAINRAKAEALIEAGRMRPGGAAEIEAARADGRWDSAYVGSRTAEVPDDLRAALDANPVAAEHFSRLSRTNRYAILYRIDSVKRAETRARKILAYVEMLAAGETIHP